MERLFATNLRVHRERKGMTQAQFAEEMTARGIPGWRQQTVTRVENGRRRVWLGEAQVAAAVLDTLVDRLLWAQGDDAAQVLAGQAIGRLRDASEAVTDAVARLRAAEAGAESAIKGLRHGKPTPRAAQAADHVEEALEGTSLEDAIAAGEDRWEELRDGA